VWGYGKYGDGAYRGDLPKPKKTTKLQRAEGQIVAWCKSRVGLPYVWGAKAKLGYEWMSVPLDCSGLTAAAYRVAHKVDAKDFPILPDGSVNQHAATHRLGYHRSAKKLKIGDLGFLHYGGLDGRPVHHVGIYIGHSWVVEARGRSWGVVKTSLKQFTIRGAEWHRARKR
jgi:cell wall-associated NlpC family hydrolase